MVKELTINGSKLKLDYGSQNPATNTSNMTCKFTFGDDTEDYAYSRKAFFQYLDSTIFKVNIASDGTCEVPKEVIAYPCFKVNVVMTAQDGRQIATNVVEIPCNDTPIYIQADQ